MKTKILHLSILLLLSVSLFSQQFQPLYLIDWSTTNRMFPLTQTYNGFTGVQQYANFDTAVWGAIDTTQAYTWLKPQLENVGDVQINSVNQFVVSSNHFTGAMTLQLDTTSSGYVRYTPLGGFGPQSLMEAYHNSGPNIQINRGRWNSVDDTPENLNDGDFLQRYLYNAWTESSGFRRGVMESRFNLREYDSGNGMPLGEWKLFNRNVSNTGTFINTATDQMLKVDTTITFFQDLYYLKNTAPLYDSSAQIWNPSGVPDWIDLGTIAANANKNGMFSTSNEAGTWSVQNFNIAANTTMTGANFDFIGTGLNEFRMIDLQNSAEIRTAVLGNREGRFLVAPSNTYMRIDNTGITDARANVEVNQSGEVILQSSNATGTIDAFNLNMGPEFLTIDGLPDYASNTAAEAALPIDGLYTVLAENASVRIAGGTAAPSDTWLKPALETTPFVAITAGTSGLYIDDASNGNFTLEDGYFSVFKDDGTDESLVDVSPNSARMRSVSVDGPSFISANSDGLELDNGYDNATRGMKMYMTEKASIFVPSQRDSSIVFNYVHGAAFDNHLLELSGRNNVRNVRLYDTYDFIDATPTFANSIQSWTTAGVPSWIDGSSFNDNIYTTNGTLTGTRTITQNTNDLFFINDASSTFYITDAAVSNYSSFGTTGYYMGYTDGASGFSTQTGGMTGADAFWNHNATSATQSTDMQNTNDLSAGELGFSSESNVDGVDANDVNFYVGEWSDGTVDLTGITLANNSGLANKLNGAYQHLRYETTTKTFSLFDNTLIFDDAEVPAVTSSATSFMQWTGDGTNANPAATRVERGVVTILESTATATVSFAANMPDATYQVSLAIEEGAGAPSGNELDVRISSGTIAVSGFTVETGLLDVGESLIIHWSATDY